MHISVANLNYKNNYFMKQRETYLRLLIFELYGEGNKEKFKFSYNQLSSNSRSEMITVYKSLGGLLNLPPSRFGAWDIVSTNFIIELDEEQHFNRYREQTLRSAIYVENSSVSIDKYIRYCDIFETNCLKKATFGKYWKNSSTEKQFGISSTKGDFSGNGSSRWKQRAFYDFCRDLYAKEFGFRLVRLSIYDEISTSSGKVELGIALEKGLRTDLVKFLKGMIDG